MANKYQITCINKSDRNNAHERITHIGGKNNDGTPWKVTVSMAIQKMEKGEWEFYVHRGGYTIEVVVATRNGNKYLKTKNDGEQPDNLLSLPECS